MEKYRLMLVYTFFFFVAALTIIVIGTNLAYEVTTNRVEERPSSVPANQQWVVQKITKGVPPIKIVTQTEFRTGVPDNYQTSKTRKIHWPNILGIVGFSVFMSGIFIFIGSALLMVISKIDFPAPKNLHLGHK